MDKSEKAKYLSQKYLNNTNVTFKIEDFNDRQLNPRGWQYKKFGNSSEGSNKLNYCRENMNLVEDNSKYAKNDYDFRYEQHLIFVNEDIVIEVSTSPSRSGNNCSYSFFTVEKDKASSL